MDSHVAEYVALGSSFGAGPGLRPRAPGGPRRSGRSAVNYPHLFAATARLRLRDVTYSGATTADLLGPGAGGVPAQLDAVTAETRLVTMSIGGNDIGYVGGLSIASLPRPVQALPRMRRRLGDALDPGTLDARFDGLGARLGDIVGRIRRVAPEARVVLVDYLTILPPSGTAADLGRLPEPVADWGRTVAERLTATFRSVADELACEVAPAAAASRAHHAWSADPWTRRFQLGSRGGAPYHPNDAGMHAVAALLTELIAPVGE
ncbi:SGNH/GDSL hydrolase family protein [Leifsonia virtsii]|uniref:SGNH/GDSL hydrolase family protein n=1 Tax=Leifsonia virtsii TaxID=3035915 RepID=A0ABT8J332_9MICO|nr:SGNH/GDSL hydrolase family protein [Leifsonia virtsii]MDN4599483.1 SGNH/GDSL hydrolase family protein [Leifsonia virtsii]